MNNLLAFDHMRNIDVELKHFGRVGGANGGVFEFERRGHWMRVIAGADEGWDHVSVSLQNRCPTWDEMEFVKRMFFEDDETAMQLHVPPADHINHHPHVLHLWRPWHAEIPRPPAHFV